MSSVTLTLPMVPPSMNTNKVRSNWRGFHALKKAWQTDFECALMAARLPRPIPTAGPVEAQVSLRFPVKRRRDGENFRPLLSKALGDALVNGGWLADDTDEDWYLRVAIAREVGPPVTTIVLSWTCGEGRLESRQVPEQPVALRQGGPHS